VRKHREELILTPIGLAQCFFGARTLADVVVGLENRGRLPVLVAVQYPTAGDDDSLAIALDVGELSVPCTGAQQLSFDLGERQRKYGSEQFMRDSAYRFLLAVAVEPLAALVPKRDAAVEAKDEYVCESKNAGLLFQERGLPAKFFGLPMVGDIHEVEYDTVDLVVDSAVGQQPRQVPTAVSATDFAFSAVQRREYRFRIFGESGVVKFVGEMLEWPPDIRRSDIE
jgi:hypothetical protein